ncbi:uncharacterized protein LOC135958351 [Calliphora vicina]|uniref:uncharacterized protein LOC135958351 n=1 Tax=Calliphora vicina TaxID=7373 RepID=UPI00325BC064
MRNQCELEQQRCGGTVLNATLPVQCRNIRPGETGDCACPSLETCSVNRTNICVRTRLGCRLKTNECELERSRCQGEVVTPINQIQCRGFSPGDGGPCACPRMETCNRSNTNICVRSERGCMLLRNECELEQARCEGRNFTVVDGIQCVNFSVNVVRNCSCPNMGICSVSSPNLCATSSATQCKLLGNRCELEKARCQGEALTIAHPLQCRGLRLNTTSNCFCPRLRNCSINTINICVRENNNNNTCTLMRNECDLEQAICEGRDIRRVASIHCRNFTANTRRTCFCPNLATCNRNSSSICVINSTQCRLVRNECELEQAKCEGNNLITTHAVQCFNFQINQQSNCSCPNLITCSQNSSRICVRTRAGCKLLTTQCDWEEAKCRGEALRTLDLIHCQGFRSREERSCFCPNLQTCSRNTTIICARDPRNNCTLLRNACDLEQARCQGQALTIVPNLHCRNFTSRTRRTCLCPNLFNCSTNASTTCVKLNSGCKLLRNQCEVENEKCQGPVIIMSPLRCRRFTFGQTRPCTCPNLKTCSRNNTNICVRTTTGCRLMRNECELEELRCQGQNLRVLPAVQCKRLRSGREGACACSNWLNCQRNSSRVCIETRRGCRLLQNQCDLEERRCRGEVLNVTTPLQCQGFALGQLRNCACPELKTCSRNNSTRVLRPICVKGPRGCKLMNTDCDLQLARCRGEIWSRTDDLQCRGFILGQQIIPLILIILFLQELSLTSSQRCQGIKLDEYETCKCPESRNCNRNRQICGRRGRQCKLFQSDCDFRNSSCRDEIWQSISLSNCCQFTVNDTKACTTNLTRTVCGRASNNRCRNFPTRCDLNKANRRNNEWSLVNQSNCKCIRSGRTGTCAERIVCTPPTNRIPRICGRQGRTHRMFRSQCHLRLHNYQKCTNFRAVRTRLCRRREG